MRWVLAALAVVLLFIGTALASVLDHAPAPEFAPETPNIGTGPASLLPIDQPLSATLFLTGGTGSADDPYSFCVISARGDGQPSCLFNQALVGFSGELPLFEWYRLTASFAEAPADGRGVGRVLSVSPTTWARVAGPARERQSRFNERSEALSNWAVAHGIIGYPAW